MLFVCPQPESAEEALGMPLYRSLQAFLYPVLSKTEKSLQFDLDRSPLDGAHAQEKQHNGELEVSK